MNDDPTYNGDFEEWMPMHAKPIVTSSNIPVMPSLTDNALEQVTNYIGKLQNAIRELDARLTEAHEKIEDQAKFIDILQRQIAIAETYLVKKLDSTK
jgi:peptidoglycan hydrolase CwlO-like protein